jgi:hypothetical protein
MQFLFACLHLCCFASYNCWGQKSMQDPCLQLTGPSRSIVATEPVDFEIQLKVKGRRRNASEDRVLMHQTFVYSGRTSTLLSNDYCKIMLRCAKLENTVQTTVVSAHRRCSSPFSPEMPLNRSRLLLFLLASPAARPSGAPLDRALRACCSLKPSPLDPYALLLHCVGRQGLPWKPSMRPTPKV